MAPLFMEQLQCWVADLTLPLSSTWHPGPPLAQHSSPYGPWAAPQRPRPPGLPELVSHREAICGMLANRVWNPIPQTDQGNEGAGGGRKCNKGGQEKQQANLALQRDLPLRSEELLLLFPGRLLLRSTEGLAIRPTPGLSWGSGLPGQGYPRACPLPLLPHLDIQLSQSGLDILGSGFKFHL